MRGSIIVIEGYHLLNRQQSRHSPITCESDAALAHRNKRIVSALGTAPPYEGSKQYQEILSRNTPVVVSYRKVATLVNSLRVGNSQIMIDVMNQGCEDNRKLDKRI
jgi:hypothetical protein